MALELPLGLPRLHVEEPISIADLLVQPTTKATWLRPDGADNQPKNVNHLLTPAQGWRKGQGYEDHEPSSFPGGRQHDQFG